MKRNSVQSFVTAEESRMLLKFTKAISYYIEFKLMSEHDLSYNEYLVLDLLNRRSNDKGEYLQLGQIAHSIYLSPSGTTRLIDRLVNRALLTRSQCPNDRRGVHAQLTELGAEALTRAQASTFFAIQNALAEIGKNSVCFPS